MKTIRQIADELGVSKQAVTDKIDKLGLQSTLQKNANRYSVPKPTETALLKAFNKNNNDKTSPSKHQPIDKLYNILQSELNAKNKQLEEKDKQISELTSALVASQQNAATAQALHAGTLQQQLISSTDEEACADEREPELPKRGFFGMFNKKRRPD
jgi:predicted DNA-binding protein YlxM (UPF0122 family)